jgi:DNA-binding NtrC family response regulator
MRANGPAKSDAPPLSGQRVLIVEDLEDARSSLQQLLQLSLGLAADVAEDGEKGLEKLLERPYSLVITDLRMPRLGGMKLIEQIQHRKLPVTVIVTTGHGSINDAVQAMRMGAYDFLTKPADPQHLTLIVERALRERALQDEVALLREKLTGSHTFSNIISQNPRMLDLFELIGQVADSNSTILIEGETGTGKEQIARAIHQAASRSRQGPMVALNCAALPETLLESELFGHEKGSFTGAAGQRRGRFEQADQGTLFLDEVGDVPMSMQVKLLRVLQERTFERVGGSDTIEIDVRVIAATNRPLEKLVRDGKFREDLYYRLNVVKIDIPPLRDRPEDIPLLAAHFSQKYARHGQVPQIGPDTMDVLAKYPWPGNVRQLENAIERACITARDGVISPAHLPADISGRKDSKPAIPIDLTRPLPVQLSEFTAAFEERYLRRALKKTRGHVGKCAKISGLSRRSITDKIAQYQIDKDAYKKDEV